MSVFGDRLRMVRVARGMTQEELAEVADIARTMVGRYETTEQMPSLDTLVRLADALNTSTDCLLGRTEQIDVAYAPQKSTAVPKRARFPKTVSELENFIRQIIRDEK